MSQLESVGDIAFPKVCRVGFFNDLTNEFGLSRRQTSPNALQHCRIQER